MQLPVPSGFINQTALAASLLVIPLILLYLLKPKPKRIRFPTIMFIKRLEETKRFSSFLNRFVKDPLLLIQIAMLVILALAMANPYALMEKPKFEVEAIAIVIDGSASMQAADVNPTRFATAVEKAKEIISNVGEESKVSLIIAENIPITILNNGDTKKAISLLDRVTCGDTPSNTADALILAKDVLSESRLKKTAYLISDFSKADGDVLTSRRILKLNGINVQFIRLNNEGSNTGIVDIEAKRVSMNRNVVYLTYTIRNYDESEHEIASKVYIDGTVSSMETKTIKPLSEELFYVNSSVTNNRHLITIEVPNGGMLAVDDTGYAVIPQLRTYKTMLLTSGDSDKFVSYAIEAQLNNRLRTVEPPVIPSLSEFDTIVVGGIKKENILPGTFRDIKNFVESGKSLIIIASPDLAGMEDQNFEELMPVKLKEMVNSEKNVKSTNHEILNDVSLENVVVKRYYKAEKKENATVIAETEGNPMIAYWNYGKGKVAYIGINPSKDWSNMHYSSSFPIFWSQLISYINQRDELVRSLNFKTGEYLVLEKECEITNPRGAKTNAKSLFLDKQGFYTIRSNDKEEIIAVNLENEDESNIKTVVYEEEITQRVEVEEKTTKEELFKYLLLVGALILFFEMTVYRRRGLL